MKNGLTFLALVVLAAVAGWYSLSPQFPFQLGLDLRGGMRVTLEPDESKTPATETITPETINAVKNVLENRVNSFGLSGADVRVKGDRQVLISLPGASNKEDVLKSLTSVAQLEFRHLNNAQSKNNPGARYRMTVKTGNASKGEPDSYSFTDSADGDKAVDQAMVIAAAPLILRGDSLKPESRPEINPSNGEPLVTFALKDEGARTFANFTSENQGEILAIVLDNKIVSAPNIDEPITEGNGIIRGGFTTIAEAKVLANLLNSGALPIPMKPVEIQSVGATLGQESIDKSLQAGLAGLGLVLVFMVCYYWLPGVIACVALLVYTAISLALFKGVGIFPPIVMDLPGITGFILSVGMAVDANVLIFERLKEELRGGKGVHAAVDAGFSRAFSSILDSNVTTWIVCSILVWLGTPIIRGFAITLALGVAVSMFTAITVTRTILHLVMSQSWARNEKLFGLNVGWLQLVFPASRDGAILKVFDKRRIYFGSTILLSVLALIFIAMTPFGKGLQTGIDFTGGSVIEAAFRANDVTREQIVGVLSKNGVEDAIVSVGASESPWSQVVVKATEVDPVNVELAKTRLSGVRGFDATAYTSSQKDKQFEARATFTRKVEQAEVLQALQTLGARGESAPVLKGLSVAVTEQPRTGSAAVKVAEIRSQHLSPEKMTAVKAELEQIGGGIIEPMYQQTTIGPSVAKEVTQNAFASVAVASLAIILYLAFRFAIGGFVNGLKFGICAVVALVHDVGITIGLFALMGAVANWQIDSLFVTAALTILGFSVHDTIVVYDRIRENLRHRKKAETFAEVSDRSITQTFDRSINTSLTVLLVVFALVVMGGDSVRLFNIALLFGIAIGTYSSIFVASPLVVLIEQKLSVRERALAAAGGGSVKKRDDVALTPARPRRETSSPAPVRPTLASADGEQPEGGEDAAAAEVRSRPAGMATVKPKKKRRL